MTSTAARGAGLRALTITDDRNTLAVDARTMRRDGWMFYRSDNGVWVVEHVPPRYLSHRSPRV
jgi:RNA:NAD 2'-phosphotransferase (TPT1/KptA family)